MALIQFNGKTKAEWESLNPILADGEMVYETDTLVTVMGNGVDNYVTLRGNVSIGSKILEYSAQLYQDGTSNPIFQYPQVQTLLVNPGGGWSGSDYIPAQAITRQVAIKRISVGLYQIYLFYNNSDASTITEPTKVALMLGDSAARVTERSVGQVASGLSFVAWKIKTYTPEGVLSDSVLLGNNGTYVNIKLYE